jgi:hypothetical protein
MAIERIWKQIDPVPFTVDGTEGGIVTVEDTACFKVKMAVVLKADGTEPKRYEVKRVLSKIQLVLGPERDSIQKRSDISAYTVALNSTIEAPEQERPKIPPADYERAVYEEEPTVAKRVVDVDKYGDIYTFDNPKPVTEAGFSEEDRIKAALLCAPDLVRDMTWQEIDGVRRLVQIVFTSDAVNVEFEAIISLTRDFTYQLVDPFDLVKIEDTLVVT